MSGPVSSLAPPTVGLQQQQPRIQRQEQNFLGESLAVICSGTSVLLPLPTFLHVLGSTLLALFVFLAIWRRRKLRYEEASIFEPQHPLLLQQKKRLSRNDPPLHTLQQWDPLSDSHQRRQQPESYAQSYIWTTASKETPHVRREAYTGNSDEEQPLLQRSTLSTDAATAAAAAAESSQRNAEEEDDTEAVAAEPGIEAAAAGPAVQRGYRVSLLGKALHVALLLLVGGLLLLLFGLVAVETCIPVEKSELLWKQRATTYIAVWIATFCGLYGLQLFHPYLPWFFHLRCSLSEATFVTFSAASRRSSRRRRRVRRLQKQQQQEWRRTAGTCSSAAAVCTGEAVLHKSKPELHQQQQGQKEEQQQPLLHEASEEDRRKEQHQRQQWPRPQLHQQQTHEQPRGVAAKALLPFKEWAAERSSSTCSAQSAADQWRSAHRQQQEAQDTAAEKDEDVEEEEEEEEEEGSLEQEAAADCGVKDALTRFVDECRQLTFNAAFFFLFGIPAGNSGAGVTQGRGRAKYRRKSSSGSAAAAAADVLTQLLPVRRIRQTAAEAAAQQKAAAAYGAQSPAAAAACYHRKIRTAAAEEDSAGEQDAASGSLNERIAAALLSRRSRTTTNMPTAATGDGVAGVDAEAGATAAARETEERKAAVRSVQATEGRGGTAYAARRKGEALRSLQLGAAAIGRESSRVVYWQGRRCAYDPLLSRFVVAKSELPAAERGESVVRRRLRAGGLSTEEAAARLRTFGSNSLPVCSPSLATALQAESTDPVFLLQLLLVCNSFFWRSYLVSAVWLLLAIYGICSKLWIARRNQAKIQALSQERQNAAVRVVRDAGVVKQIPGKAVVPGDLVLLSAGSLVPADVLLLQGGAAADESDITGEIIPVQKRPWLASEDIEGAAAAEGVLRAAAAGRRSTTRKGKQLLRAAELHVVEREGGGGGSSNSSDKQRRPKSNLLPAALQHSKNAERSSRSNGTRSSRSNSRSSRSNSSSRTNSSSRANSTSGNNSSSRRSGTGSRERENGKYMQATGTRRVSHPQNGTNHSRSNERIEKQQKLSAAGEDSCCARRRPSARRFRFNRPSASLFTLFAGTRIVYVTEAAAPKQPPTQQQPETRSAHEGDAATVGTAAATAGRRAARAAAVESATEARATKTCARAAAAAGTRGKRRGAASAVSIATAPSTTAATTGETATRGASTSREGGTNAERDGEERPVVCPAAATAAAAAPGSTVEQTAASFLDEPSSCVGLVLRTGSSTAGGGLLQQTFFPSLLLFKYDAQLPTAMLLLLLYAAAVIVVLFRYSPNATGVAGWFYALGTLSQLLPVWTPVLIATAQAASAARLERKKILTLAPQRIAVCGKVRLVAFDKTGTLTQKGMQFAGVLRTTAVTQQTPAKHFSAEAATAASSESNGATAAVLEEKRKAGHTGAAGGRGSAAVEAPAGRSVKKAHAEKTAAAEDSGEEEGEESTTAGIAAETIAARSREVRRAAGGTAAVDKVFFFCQHSEVCNAAPHGGAACRSRHRPAAATTRPGLRPARGLPAPLQLDEPRKESLASPRRATCSSVLLPAAAVAANDGEEEEEENRGRDAATEAAAIARQSSMLCGWGLAACQSLEVVRGSSFFSRSQTARGVQKKPEQQRQQQEEQPPEEEQEEQQQQQEQKQGEEEERQPKQQQQPVDVVTPTIMHDAQEQAKTHALLFRATARKGWDWRLLGRSRLWRRLCSSVNAMRVLSGRSVDVLGSTRDSPQRARAAGRRPAAAATQAATGEIHCIAGTGESDAQHFGVLGSELDIRMLQATGWRLVDVCVDGPAAASCVVAAAAAQSPAHRSREGRRRNGNCGSADSSVSRNNGSRNRSSGNRDRDYGSSRSDSSSKSKSGRSCSDSGRRTFVGRMGSGEKSGSGKEMRSATASRRRWVVPPELFGHLLQQKSVPRPQQQQRRGSGWAEGMLHAKQQQRGENEEGNDTRLHVPQRKDGRRGGTSGTQERTKDDDVLPPLKAEEEDSMLHAAENELEECKTLGIAVDSAGFDEDVWLNSGAAEILKVFPFDYALQRMSVIVRLRGVPTSPVLLPALTRTAKRRRVAAVSTVAVADASTTAVAAASTPAVAAASTPAVAAASTAAVAAASSATSSGSSTAASAAGAASAAAAADSGLSPRCSRRSSTYSRRSSNCSRIRSQGGHRRSSSNNNKESSNSSSSSTGRSSSFFTAQSNTPVGAPDKEHKGEVDEGNGREEDEAETTNWEDTEGGVATEPLLLQRGSVVQSIRTAAGARAAGLVSTSAGAAEGRIGTGGGEKRRESEGKGQSQIVQERVESCGEDSFFVFCKGSYESVESLCVSGLPQHYRRHCETLAAQGFYVLALACKPLQTTRAEVESPLPTAEMAVAEVPRSSSSSKASSPSSSRSPGDSRRESCDAREGSTGRAGSSSRRAHSRRKGDSRRSSGAHDTSVEDRSSSERSRNNSKTAGGRRRRRSNSSGRSSSSSSRGRLFTASSDCLSSRGESEKSSSDAVKRNGIFCRAAAEEGLHFLGLLIFRNELKRDAAEAIRQLKQGKIRPVMVTGDNLLTACCVAQQCGMLLTSVNTDSSNGSRGSGSSSTGTSSSSRGSSRSKRGPSSSNIKSRRRKSRSNSNSSDVNSSGETSRSSRTKRNSSSRSDREADMYECSGVKVVEVEEREDACGEITGLPPILLRGARGSNSTSSRLPAQSGGSVRQESSRRNSEEEKGSLRSKRSGTSRRGRGTEGRDDGGSSSGNSKYRRSGRRSYSNRTNRRHAIGDSSRDCCLLKQKHAAAEGAAEEAAAEAAALAEVARQPWDGEAPWEEEQRMPLLQAQEKKVKRNGREDVEEKRGSSQQEPVLLIGELTCAPQTKQTGVRWRVWQQGKKEKTLSDEEVYFSLLQRHPPPFQLAVTEQVYDYLARTPLQQFFTSNVPLATEKKFAAAALGREGREGTADRRKETVTAAGINFSAIPEAIPSPQEQQPKVPAEATRQLQYKQQCKQQREHQQQQQNAAWEGIVVEKRTKEEEEEASAGAALLMAGEQQPPSFRTDPFATAAADATRTAAAAAAEWRMAAGTAATLSSAQATSLLDVLLMHIRIFARMSPAGKKRVVLAFMRRGVVTCMCGDGGNDCAALRAAHAGLALSEHSASVLSPFTAASLSPTAAADLLKEGRCSLATGLAAYKFLVLYGLLLSLVKMLLLVFGGGSCLSQAVYFVLDVVILLGMSKVMVRARPKEVLRTRSPTASLLGPSTVLSVAAVLLVDFVFLCLLYSQLRLAGLGVDLSYQASLPSQAWWMRSDTYEAASCAVWICAQLVNAAFIFSLGGMFRENIYRNAALVFSTVMSQALLVAITFAPTTRISCLLRINCTDEASRSLALPLPAWIARPAAGMPLYNPHGSTVFPFSWKVQLTLLSLGNALLSTLVVKFFFSAAFLKFLRACVNCPGESDSLII